MGKGWESSIITSLVVHDYLHVQGRHLHEIYEGHSRQPELVCLRSEGVVGGMISEMSTRLSMSIAEAGSGGSTHTFCSLAFAMIASINFRYEPERRFFFLIRRLLFLHLASKQILIQRHYLKQFILDMMMISLN